MNIDAIWNLTTQLLESHSAHKLFIWGPPASGKTYAALHTGNGRLSNGCYAVTMTEDTPVAELRGHYVPKGGDFQWKDGPIVSAMREGARLVLNEISHAPAEVISFLHAVTEERSTARFTLPTGEEIRPAEGFHVIATDNAPLENLPDALASRFEICLHVTDPPEEAYLSLGRLAEPAKRLNQQIQEDGDLRRRFLNGPPTIRHWRAVQLLLEDMDLETALSAVFGLELAPTLSDAIALSEIHTAGVKV